MEIRLSRRRRTEESENTVLDAAQNVLSTVENTIQETTEMMNHPPKLSVHGWRSCSPGSMPQSPHQQLSPWQRALSCLRSDMASAVQAPPTMPELQPHASMQTPPNVSAHQPHTTAHRAVGRRRQPWIEPVDTTQHSPTVKQPVYILHDGDTSE